MGNNAGTITEINCNTYDSQAAGYVSVYTNAPEFTASSHTYANDLAYFKRAYCGTSTSVQTPKCYIVSRNGVAKSKVVVADCAQGMTAKIYFVQSGDAMAAGTQTSLPTTYDTYVSFVAACNQCSGTTTGTWAAIDNPSGYQLRPNYTISSKFCNICQSTQSGGVFRCASGYYGPTNQNSPTGCTKCTNSSAISATSTPGSNTTASSCSFKCANGYYGTATNATTGCTKCPTNATCAGGNGSTFVCNSGYYNTGTAAYGCQACADVENYSTGVAVCNNTGIKCKAGYYGTYHNGVPIMKSCTTCPYYGEASYFETFGTCYNVTSDEGSIGVASCYIKAGACEWTDESGTFTYSSDCSYTE